jgi:hypothetical protein
MKLIHKLLSILIALLIAQSTQAQVKDTAESEKYRYVIPYKPVLSESKRMAENPVIEKSKAAKPTFSYQVIPMQFQTDKIVHTLPPVNHKLKFQNPVKGNYVKYGMGNLNGVLGELYLGNKNSEKFGYGVSYKHYSANERKTLRNMSRNSARIFGNVYNAKTSYGASFDYNRLGITYFGYDEGIINSPKKKDIQQLIDNYSVNAYIQKNKAGMKGFMYKSNFAFDYLEDPGLLKETEYKFSTELIRQVKGMKGGAIISAEYLNSENLVDSNIGTRSRTILNLNPNILYKMGKSELYGSLNTFLSDGIGSSTLNLYVFPVAEFRYKLIPGQLITRIGASGDLEGFKHKDYYTRNPFVNEFTILKNQITSWNLYAGIKGEISNRTDIVLTAGIKKVSNLLMFGHSGDSLNRSKAVSDDARVIYLQGQFNYSVSEKVRLGMDIEFNDYKLKDTDVPRELPGMRIGVKGQYKLGKKLMGKVNFISLGSREQFDVVSMSEKSLKSYNDLNIGLEYYYKTASIFLNFNNVLGQEYEQHYRYDAYGFNILGGLTLRL